MLQFIFVSLLLYYSQYAAGIPVSSSIYSQEADVWLSLHIVPTTWLKAALQCQLEGGVLATPTTSGLAETMRAAMADNKLPSNRVFIGVTNSFSRGDYKSLEGTPIADIPLEWAAAEPDNAADAEHCLALTGAGALAAAADVSCSSVLPYFCRKFPCVANCTTAVPSCKAMEGYVWEARTGSHYKFHGTAEAWFPALQTCHAEGGHLAIINSNTESTVLKEIYDKNKNKIIGAIDKRYTLIGFKQWFGGEWVTVRGETLAKAGFAVWSPGEPSNCGGSERCGSIFHNGLLNNAGCDAKFPYICEITPLK